MEALKKQVSLPLLLFPFLPFFLHLAQGEDDRPPSDCSPFQYKCGSVALNIRYPFRADVHRHSCFHPAKDFEIACNHTDNSSEIDIQNHKYHVSMIDYENQSLTVVRKDFFGSKSDNNSCRLTSFENTALEYSEFFRYYDEEDFNLTFLHDCSDLGDYQGVKFLPCLSDKTRGRLAFFTIEPDPEIIQEKFGEYCQVVKIPILRKYRDRLEKASPESDAEAAWKEALRNGFQITWSPIDPSNQCRNCVRSNGHCGRDESSPNQQPICYCNGQPQTHTCPPQDSYNAFAGRHNNQGLAMKVAIPVVGGVLLCATTIICFWYRKRPISSTNIEAFLENYASPVPKRYRYSELKKITNSFKDMLGQGGFGSVFKGQLNDGPLVAVKILNKSKEGNGEEFINEVASIGRTHHVNVVTLLGFCSEGSKSALVYEFMSNGSLDKFIYSKKRGTENTLDCQKLLDISLGIARGLEYLHRGCNTRILHLDIKPHNILLDDNFCPKISDFGLAKLCPGQQSTISMLDGRGTAGYIAPEVFCRNIGGVSHKSDVYSYGMMVLEMIGGRKNIDARVDNTSEIYFPHWVHKHINIEESRGLFGFRTEEEEQIARKIVIVGLWCIQTDPKNRPSISKVVEMLEGSLGSLEMPPKPYLSSPSRSCSSTT